MRISLFLFLVFLLSLSSCSSDCTEIGVEKIDVNGWAYQDSIEFNLIATDTNDYYDLVLELEHSPDFNFQNLYIQSSTHFPSGETIMDPISINLGDLSGTWNGECSRKACVAPVLLRSQFRFLETGNHKIVFEQF